MLYAAIAAFIVLLALTVLIVTGRMITSTMLYPRHFTWPEGEEHDRKMGAWAEGEFERQPKERFSITSFDGLKLNALWLSCGQKTNKAVVIMHGFGCCAVNSYKYARPFLARGYDALIYDNRNSGESEGTRTTLGFHERRDLMDMYAVARERVGEGGIVGLHGESEGGATVLLAACSLAQKPDFIVSDCPFADLARETVDAMRCTGPALPYFPFVPFASLVCKLRAGFFFSEVSPVNELKRGDGLEDVPVLFVHGTADDYIPTVNSQQLYDAKRGAKRLWLCEGAKHARSMATDPEGYREELNSFLDLIGK